MLFALGTLNAPKSAGIREALAHCPYFDPANIEIQGFKVASLVPDMPLTLQEMRDGARNRARNIRPLCPTADFYVGMEGGVCPDIVGEEYWILGVVYIENLAGQGHFGYSSHMPVPPRVVEALLDGSGRDLEMINHAICGIENVGDREGSFGLWSDMMLTRTEQFKLATQCAIVPFFNKFYL